MPRIFASPADLPDEVPLFPLAGALLLPGSHRPLSIFEPRYLDMIDFALGQDRLIGLIQPRGTITESPRGRDVPLERIGCVGRITHFEESAPDRYLIVLEGLSRFELIEESRTGFAFRTARISAHAYAEDFAASAPDASIDRDRFITLLRAYAEFARLEPDWSEIERTGTADLVDLCCMLGPFSPAEKQALLEAPDIPARAEILIAMAELEMARGKGGTPLQ